MIFLAYWKGYEVRRLRTAIAMMGTLRGAGNTSESLGNIIINKQGSDTLWKFDLSDKVWIAKNKLKLKEKELEILRLYAQGLTINQIAEKMFVSPDTIKYYRRKIFETFEVKNFTEALSFALDNKII